MKILLAEDERDLSRAVTAVMKHEGYEVDAAYDGEEADTLAGLNSYDAIVLDIMMPKKDGIEVLRNLRERADVTPVLMLTAKAEIENRVEGLDAGADDYLTKPFAMKELLARLRSMTRRKDTYMPRKLVLGNTTLNTENYELSSGNAIRLGKTEAELMGLFMLNPEKTFSTEELFEHIWKNDSDVDRGVVWAYVSFLRKKLFSVAADIEIKGEKGGSFRLSAMKSDV